ncbi:hypothetical protein DH2020_001886 [Rehmannia glutinosa]|uniref:Uncharacterized protein n=1 Tax=Rehmannia glutinosa TaxID=99300 RepID=A0ABR0XSL0_REHGL
MENSWQSKCGSLWQQLPPPQPLVASSSHGSHTQLPHESMPLIRETIQEHMPSNLRDLKNLDHANLGVPLFSFLSGPPAHVPCDRQHLLYPKPGPPSSQVSLRTGNGFSAGSRVSVLPSALWPPNMECQNLISGEVFPSLMLANSTMNCSNSSDVLQAANLNFQKLQAVACQNPHEKDKGKSFSSLIRNNNAGPIPANNWKLQKYADITALQKVPLECNVSANRHGHNPSSSFPRVFCSGISSCDFDPGSAVRMDNGEAIAQWWKTFFSKSGIRVLEGHRGWDWPEGISAASGSTDHPITNMSNNFVLWNENGSFRTSLSYEQQNYSVLNSKENQSCRNVVDEYAYHEKDRTSQECSNSLFKYIINSSGGNLQHPADKQLWGIPNSFGMNTEKASHSTTAKLDSVCGSANSLPALPYIQDLKTPFIGFGVRRNTSFIVERPGLSSNIELRLGQPEQSQTLETKVIPAFESHLNGMQAEPPKVFLTDKILQKTGNELQGSKWTVQNADIASNPTERRGPTQLEHSSHVGGAYGALTDRKNSSSGNFKMTDLNPPFLSCFKNPETKWQFRNFYDNDNDNHVTEKLHYESHAPQSEKICFPWSPLAGNIKEFQTGVSNGQNHINKGKKMDCAVNGLLDAAKSNTEFSNTFKEDLRNSVFVQNVTPTLSKENFRGVNPGLQDENMQMPTVQNMVELSNRNNDPASVRNVQGCEILKNPCIQSLMTIAPSISKDHVPLLDSSMMPRIPDIGEKSTLPGTNCWMGHTNERFGTMTDSNKLYNISSFSPGRSSSAGASDLPPVEQFFLRPGGIECNFTLSKKEPSSQGLSYAYVPEKRISAVQANCLTGKYGTNDDYYCNLAKGAKNGAAASSFHSKLNENCFFLKERTKCLEKNLVPPNFKSAESHSFQWRDVPKKIMESCSSTRKEQQAGSFKASLGSPAADVFRCFTGCAQNVVPLKEHETSNISSRCSAPDVTQSSIEVNKKDSSIVEGGDIRCANNLVVEEGSGNDRSWSSDDALDNELCAGFSGSASEINLIKRGPLNVFPREPSLSLIEEIRLQNSLKSKYAPYQIKRSSTFQEESDHLQKFEVGSKKRRKTVKWMKLDAPFSVSGQSSINSESPKCTEEVGQNAHSIWDMQMPVGFDHGSPSNCADSFEQSLKQRNTALSAVKGITSRET